jgi:hypothetical protein
MRCNGITKYDQPCKNSALPHRSHCQWHGPICQGIKKGDDTPCRARAKNEFDWVYCCKAHVPNSTKPEVFRIEGLRALKTEVVLEYRSREDAYTGCVVTSVKGKELDHVVELHTVRDDFDAIPKHGMSFEKNKKQLLEFVRDSVVNEDFNLNFTTKDINLMKFKAFDAFQEDYRQGIGRQVQQGLFPYLEDEYDGRFTRKISGNIQIEVKSAMESILSAFEEEQPLHGYMVQNLQDRLTAMRLN